MGEAPVTLDDVGRALGRTGWRLAFEPALERRFEADTAAARCRRVVRQNHIGLIIYNSFMLGDWLLIPDIIGFSVVLHLLVMTPAMGLVNLVVARRPPAWLREGVLAGGIVLGTAAILLLTLMSRSPLRTSEHLSVVLVILFATTVQRLRFTFAVAACLASLALYVAALVPFAAHDAPRVMVADAVCAGAVLFSLIGCYNLEAELRSGYLLSLRDRLRNEELDRISRRDPLTGIGNRRALDAALDRALDTAPAASPRRAGRAVLLVDIDHFKLFNDTNGHLAGDGCLKRVAALIAAEPGVDPAGVFRFGGEEFLVLLDGAGTAQARVVGEGIRRSVRAAAIRRHASTDAVVTVSIGVAAGETAAALIGAADEALYAAKRLGRDMVCARACAGPADGAAGHPRVLAEA